MLNTKSGSVFITILSFDRESIVHEKDEEKDSPIAFWRINAQCLVGMTTKPQRKTVVVKSFSKNFIEEGIYKIDPNGDFEYPLLSLLKPKTFTTKTPTF